MKLLIFIDNTLKNRSASAAMIVLVFHDHRKALNGACSVRGDNTKTFCG